MFLNGQLTTILGVFGDGLVSNFSVIADAPCYVITINKQWIWQASDNVWEVGVSA